MLSHPWAFDSKRYITASMTNQKQHYLTKWHDKHTNIRAGSVWICLDSIRNGYFTQTACVKILNLSQGEIDSQSTANACLLGMTARWLILHLYTIFQVLYFSFFTFWLFFFIPYQVHFSYIHIYKEHWLIAWFWVKFTLILQMYNIDLILNMHVSVFVCLGGFFLGLIMFHENVITGPADENDILLQTSLII